MSMKRAILSLVAILVVGPLISYALTLDEIKAQLNGLLEQLSALNVQAGSANTVTTFTSSCPQFERNLGYGMSGEDVASLQQFLIRIDFLAAGNATGYFGPLTEEAVKRWQSQQGIVSSGDPASTGYGFVGPQTRQSVLINCAPQTPSQTVTVPATQNCPTEPPVPPASLCTGVWQKGLDAGGCVTGYQCIVSVTETNTEAVAPSIEVLEPSAGTAVTGGNSLAISWRSMNTPASAAVTVVLLDASGQVVSELAQGLAPSGSYSWRVPSESTECAAGESAFDCIEKLASCGGSASLCSVEPGTYIIRVSISDTLTAKSAPFQVAGTVISDLLRALVGAPVVPPPTPSTSASPANSANSCMHDDQSYAEGMTISVPCEKGHCTSATSGFITGTCTAGQWCIPQTTYCAASFAAINVSAYTGGGTPPVVQSGYSVGCPQEGWRAHLSCPYGGCTSGWNICRGGKWVLDPSYKLQIDVSSSLGNSCTVEGQKEFFKCPSNTSCAADPGWFTCRSGTWVRECDGLACYQP